MEIALLQKKGIKIRGKQTSILINGTDKSVVFSAIILLGKDKDEALKEKGGAVVIDGPGEYELGGIKISGIKSDGNTTYSLKVDDIDILLGSIETLEKMHQKLKEHQILVVQTDTAVDASFVTSLASSAVILYGEKADEVAKTFAKDAVKNMAKYQATKDKLPPEMETILLASS